MVRAKFRYLTIEVQYSLPSGDISPLCRDPEPLNRHELTGIIRDAIEANFGEYGIGCIQGQLLARYFSPHTGIGILRAPRDHFRMVWAAITFMEKIKERPCAIRVLHCSGTVKKSQLYVINHQRNTLLHLSTGKDSHLLERKRLLGERDRDIKMHPTLLAPANHHPLSFPGDVKAIHAQVKLDEQQLHMDDPTMGKV
ncbi:MAG: Rpp14/Pop5 family-domain-containing protein [Piptocephalis tieghemiana]|nr:MAG: Rpp14/Pop5 family-domain-containing protein [Piptocephalis tieghemiana]